MKKIGFIGWRGMVGSVLMQRMAECNDFDGSFCAHFFTTSQFGELAPVIADNQNELLLDANDINSLAAMDIILSCQGSDYTSVIHPQLRQQGWQGYWIDAASHLRMSDQCVIVLDPLNGELIQTSIDNGVKDFVGGNCTVSLMLLAIHGLLKADLVEWVSAMTYQAISGSGAAAMRELLQQMKFIGDNLNLDQPSVLDLERDVQQLLNSGDCPTSTIGHPLAGNLLPWIDSEMPNGQSREEWKAEVEANKILNLKPASVKIDGCCVRVSSLRCHSQGLVIGLKQDISPQYVEKLLSDSNDWVKVIANNKNDSLNFLTPVAVSGTLDIAIGRIRPMNLSGNVISAFTVGDQLLWGAAEPLRRMLKLLLR